MFAEVQVGLVCSLFVGAWPEYGSSSRVHRSSKLQQDKALVCRSTYKTNKNQRRGKRKGLAAVLVVLLRFIGAPNSSPVLLLVGWVCAAINDIFRWFGVV